MTLIDEVYAHARILAPQMNGECQAMLEAMCRSTTVSLQARLRENLTVEDCRTDFVTAAGMLALAAMSHVSFYNDFLKPSEQEYLAKEKNLKGSIEYMTPAEYYSECATKVFTSSVEKLKMERERDTYTIQHLNDVIDIYKKQFPIAIINYAEREQEGLHRMYVVGERFGWNTKHPVLVIRWADEDRAYREACAKQKARIESYIRNAIKKASYYTYYSIDELVSQLQSEVEKELQYVDEFENVGIKVKLERDDAEEAFEVIVNDYYHEYMYDDMIKMKEPVETEDDSLDDIDDDLDIDDWLAKYLSKDDMESIK